MENILVSERRSFEIVVMKCFDKRIVGFCCIELDERPDQNRYEGNERGNSRASDDTKPSREAHASLPACADGFRSDGPQAVGMDVTGVIRHYGLVSEFVFNCPARLVF